MRLLFAGLRDGRKRFQTGALGVLRHLNLKWRCGINHGKHLHRLREKQAQFPLLYALSRGPVADRPVSVTQRPIPRYTISVSHFRGFRNARHPPTCIRDGQGRLLV